MTPRIRQLRLMGWAFLALALCFGGFAYICPEVATEEASWLPTIAAHEKLGYYMIGLLTGLMGAFALASIWQRKMYIKR